MQNDDEWMNEAKYVDQKEEEEEDDDLFRAKYAHFFVHKMISHECLCQIVINLLILRRFFFFLFKFAM